MPIVVRLKEENDTQAPQNCLLLVYSKQSCTSIFPYTFRAVPQEAELFYIQTLHNIQQRKNYAAGK
jgi:hypothetical protein